MIDRELLTKFYSSDKDLISIHHVLAGSSLEECIEKTYNDLLNVEISYLKENDEIIGYYGLEKGKYCNFLVGFFIMPENRKNTRFWEEIESNLPENTYCGLFSNNKRAIRFLEKKGYSKVYSLKDTVFKIK